MKTKSEQIFENFLTSHNLLFAKIEESTTPRPDYRVSIGDTNFLFELKELTADKYFGVVDPVYPQIKISSATLGDHVRRAIAGAKRQIQFGSKQGIPSILLIYNALDPMQLFGTGDMDFTAAMYGGYTIRIDRKTMRSSDMFNGKNSLLQEQKNTSFSAVGRLCDRGGVTVVTLFENAFASVGLSYQQLPTCFDIRRVEVEQVDVGF